MCIRDSVVLLAFRIGPGIVPVYLAVGAGVPADPRQQAATLAAIQFTRKEIVRLGRILCALLLVEFCHSLCPPP